jgi:chaperone required for assembly of F1-ATPase
MRDLLEDLFENQPLDPMESARRGARPNLRKRFYAGASVGDASEEGGFPVLLDGKPVMTPRRRALAAPMPELAAQIAAEWNAQGERIDPAQMPLTRLANAAIDTVAEARAAVADEVAKYLGSDLVCYRAEGPAGLVERQAQAWDPVLAWAHEALGARFVQVQGVVFSAQPAEAIEATRAAIPSDIWRLAAVASVSGLTGSTLLALALAAGAHDAKTVWTAAHVDEDWQMAQWGRDAETLERRALRHAEFQAAATVLKLTLLNPSS